MSEVPDRSSDPTLADLLRRLEAAYEPERVYLFGSRARGEAGPDSDYDILLVMRDDAPPERKRSRWPTRCCAGPASRRTSSSGPGATSTRGSAW